MKGLPEGRIAGDGFLLCIDNRCRRPLRRESPDLWFIPQPDDGSRGVSLNYQSATSHDAKCWHSPFSSIYVVIFALGFLLQNKARPHSFSELRQLYPEETTLALNAMHQGGYPALMPILSLPISNCRTTFIAAVALFVCIAAEAKPAIKNGETIAFMGDSITAAGWSNPRGYVRLVMAGLKANGIEATAVPAGISGHKSDQMLERLQRDALDKKPDWMTLSCGVNDVWHGAKGIPLDQYKTNITAIVNQCQAQGVKVMILTATVIGEDLDNENNRKLIPYNEFLRQLAKKKKCKLADLNQTFQKAIKADAAKPGLKFTGDGVHMNPAGDQIMAKGILEALGLSKAQLSKAQESWREMH